ncbi:putative non-specific serine/threonine protein kinase [Helianthus annuus]|nr:putative non-specific serine/threonine protein kinase [Helianthus annuus]KAJ0943544.1 putative non-specific serine/threonine protein kinase [Helianthus annuus]
MEKALETDTMNINGSHYYSNVPLKSSQISPLRISTTLTVINLSSNRFEGEIPNIGDLKSLTSLNLSNNNLNGQIPHVLGNMVDMQALDLSRNQLVGEFPPSLTNLRFRLKSLRKPSCGAYSTRKPTSDIYRRLVNYGNPGLCGSPLPKRCVGAKEREWINMEAVMSGLGCGTLFGVVLGYRMLSTPKWLNAIADVGGHTRRKKRKQLKQVHIRKRN